jgi:hypothetical protein
MPAAHGAHALVESIAALVLSLGGAAVLGVGWLDRRRTATRSPTRALVGAADASSSLGSPVDAARRIIAAASLGAALIHAAAGPGHVAELGDVGLGFYGAAILQALFAVVWLGRHRSRSLALAGVALQVGLLAIWAATRTVGLPIVGIAVEPVGTADAITVALELVVVGLLIGGVIADESPRLAISPELDPTSLAMTAVVAVVGVIALSTAIAVADLGRGHDHDAPAQTLAGQLGDGTAHHH